MKNTMKNILANKNLGYMLIKTDDPNIIFPDVSKNNKKIYSGLSDYTMTGLLRIDALIESIDYVIKNNIEGSIVECGVWEVDRQWQQQLG